MSTIKPLPWLLLTVCVLGTSWVGFAQVQENTKDKTSIKKAIPKSKVEDGGEDKASPKSTKPASPKDGKKTPPAAGSAAETDHRDEEAAIRASAAAFVSAYNEHDAKAVSLLFALKAEFTDENGNLIKGRDAIEQDFAAMFAQYPECKIDVEITSIRVLTPHLALEEGIVRGHPVPDELETLSGYVAVHVNVEDHWLLASVSDYEAPAESLSANDHLQQLSWMVGDWLDESPESTIKTICRWDASGNFLLHEFEVHLAGGVSAGGSLRIGWDPLTRQLKSWTFDADGGYSEGLWARVGDEWIVKSHGVNAAGAATSSVNVFRYLDADTMTWRSYDRVAGGETLDDISENVIKRHVSPEN